ncbi:conjugal transfer protein TraJ [Phenylobacterium sp. Root77]|uniref:virB8 family protein n=1 Tax=unclassified Phenylobacterium TaxID=2640670 RepID=UPI0006FB7BCF|nr:MULTISPECIES: virB8 family protein [unclassified Phenylobacterium]KQW67027.1 conjugal transfer protein TraJ [Phenylobacterium sp. Root1277]KQW89720.1 conjugal transfer protein TraJ [Phenylobacterium sp. Root1290]KRC43591.1 conjugal transfer protein TraJ [Phenylobacterium sp. Root77]
MSGVWANELRAYFAEARRWDEDRLANARRSAVIAWTAAGASSLLALCGVLALAALTPLKRVEPYVVRVDSATGAVEVMTALKDVEARSYDEAVTKSFLASYVRAREGWLPAAAEADFRQVSLMSSAAEQQRWASVYRAGQPLSPQTQFGPAAEALVEVRAISFIAPGVANIRFHRKVRRGGAPEAASDWIATLAFSYAKAPMREADRLANPLGFQVSSYRVDPEVVR